VAFGVAPEDLIEPEVATDYTIDVDSGRIVPGEINIDSAPVFTAMLKDVRRQFDTRTREVGEAGVEIYSDWRFQAFVLSPSTNQLLRPAAPEPSLQPWNRNKRAAASAAKGGADVAPVLNPKIYSQLETQLAEHGPGSIHKAIKSALKTLAQHEAKLPGLKYKSQVEGTIKNVKRQIHTLEQFIKDKGL
jgi:hypothetical protein